MNTPSAMMRLAATLLSVLVINASFPHAATAAPRPAPAGDDRHDALPVEPPRPQTAGNASPIPTFGRLYYTGVSRSTGGAPNVTRDASWTNTYGLTAQRMLRSAPSGSLNGGGSTANSMPTPSNAYMQQYYYELTSDGTLAGYVRSIIRAARRDGTAIGDDQEHQAQMVIRVVSADGTTVRGTALAAHQPASQDSTVLPPDPTATKFPASAVWVGDIGAELTPVSYQAGDWLVIEIGTRAMLHDQGMGTSLHVNDAAASDLPINETETANLRSWIEILPPGSADEFLLGSANSPHGKKWAHLEVDPVNTATGNYVSSVTDLAMPGIGLPFNFTRTYNSLGYQAPPPSAPPNLVRFPKGGTASYSAVNYHSAPYAPQYAADGQASNTSGSYSTWAVSGWESGDWWQVSWTQPQAVDRVVLCDRRASGYYFGSSGRITFSDSSTVNWSGLPNDCGSTGANTLTVDFPRKTGITWMRVIGDSGGGGNAGLAEVFAYDIDAPNAEVREYPSPLGVGWTHPYAMHLEIDAVSGQVTFMAEDGSQIRYAADGSGGYVAPPNIFSTLAADGSGGYELTRSDAVVYSFDEDGLLTALSDRNGNQLTFAYTAGKLTTITDTAGRTITLSYTGDRLTSLSAPPSRTITYGYDSLNRLTSVTDARGEEWTYTYDDAHRLETVTDPNDHVVATNEYGADGRISAQTDATGNRGTFDWDPATQTSTYSDANANEWTDVYATNVLQSSSDPLGNSVEYAYDASLNLTAVTDPRGFATTMTYDAAGNILTRTAPSPLSYDETWTYTDLNDVETYTDGRDNTTEYDYDGDGNLIEISAPLGAITTFTRDSAGTGLLTEVTDPRGKTTTYAYDADGGVVSITTPLGHETTLEYDAAGRLIESIDARGTASGADPTDYDRTFTYDGTDNLLTTTDPLGNVTTWTYDDAGNLESVTDASTNATSYAYDDANRLTSVTDPDAGVTSYAYDDVGNLVTRTDANDHDTTYAYDDANRLTSTTDPLSNVWSLTYDDAGNVETRGDANGKTTTYTWDALNRLTGITYHDTSTPSVTFAYDANGNSTTMTDGAGTETAAFDELDRLTAVTRGSSTFSYGYDLAGNVTSRTYPGQSAQSWTYDDDGQLASANGAEYAYDEAGNVVTAETPDGITAIHTYDFAGRLLETAHVSATETLARTSYTLDPVGNPLVASTVQGSQYYTYDELNRLTGVCYDASCAGTLSPATCLQCVGSLMSLPAADLTPNGSDLETTWTYDPVGNRLTENTYLGTTDYVYDDADRLTGVDPPGSGPITYTYDDNGNQTAAGADSFTWDYADRLVSATVNSVTESYMYSGAGVRLSADRGGGDETLFLVDTNLAFPEVALELDGSDALVRRFAYGLGLVSQFTTATSSTTYLHTDGLGSIIASTDPAGDPVTWSAYQPFGEIRAYGADVALPGLAFAGQQVDGITDLYHLRARQYDASTGRFLSKDPLAQTALDPYVSTYAYVSNQPTVAVDPSGSCLQFLGGGLAAAPATGGGSAIAGGVGFLFCLGFVAAVAITAPSASESLVDLGATAVEAGSNIDFAQTKRNQLRSLREALRRQRTRIDQEGEGVKPHLRDVERGIEQEIRDILRRHPHWRRNGDPNLMMAPLMPLGPYGALSSGK